MRAGGEYRAMVQRQMETEGSPWAERISG
jgi:hypothetical protein